MTPPVNLVAVSTSRSDLGYVAPVVAGAARDPRFAVRLVLTGHHLATRSQPGVDDGVPPDARVLPAPDGGGSLSGVHQAALAGVLRDAAAELVFVVGDRYELLEVAMVASYCGVPIAHSAGGERTLGALDDDVRDAVTKLSALHLPTHEPAAARLRALGEEPFRICVAGEPCLDAIAHEAPLDAAALAAVLGFVPDRGDLVVAVHPVTRYPDETAAIVRAVDEFAREFPGRIVLTAPNGDPGREAIERAWGELAARAPRCVAVASLGPRWFRSVVARAGALVGNSSAGLIEAPSLGTPTVDVGRRQQGRVRGPSVVDCAPAADALRAAVRAARGLARDATGRFENPYGDGRAVPRILDHMAGLARRPGLCTKG